MKDVKVKPIRSGAYCSCFLTQDITTETTLYYGCQTGKCCVAVQPQTIYVALSHIRSKGISYVGVVHTQHFIRGGGRTEEVDKGSWLVDEAKTP